MSRGKNWCFTLNNYNEQDVQRLSNFNPGDGIRYLCFGREQGESGTPHLQGYVQFDDRKTLQAAKAYIAPRAHLEIARGTPQRNIEYCSKDGLFHEYGERPISQGKRSEVESAIATLAETGDLRETAEQHGPAFIRYSRGFERYRQLLFDKPRTGSVTVIVYCGSTGSGKTRRVHQQEPHVWVYGSAGWFDGYMGQEAALFDDFGGHEFKLTYLLKLLDVYPMLVPIKGGFVQWKPRRIYLTSNLPISAWYERCSLEHRQALDRRIHIVLDSFNDTWVRVKPQ
jgi:hypothetical protein